MAICIFPTACLTPAAAHFYSTCMYHMDPHFFAHTHLSELLSCYDRRPWVIIRCFGALTINRAFC